MIGYEIFGVLQKMSSIAVVGLSPKPARPSYQVASYLLQAGYIIYPVNPAQEEILGLPCYPDLFSVPGPIDIVDIFRNPRDVPAVVEAAISVRAKVVWMQEGIVHEEAAARARKAGLMVIMDRCIKTDHMNLASLL
jgi:predicted CoA-binding protein